jgi:DNA gyrase/topoisomerase IV subunit A
VEKGPYTEGYIIALDNIDEIIKLIKNQRYAYS